MHWTARRHEEEAVPHKMSIIGYTLKIILIYYPGKWQFFSGKVLEISWKIIFS
jgi:hypothetical protein